MTSAPSLPPSQLPVPNAPADDNADWQRGRAAWLYACALSGSMTDAHHGRTVPVELHRLGRIPLALAQRTTPPSSRTTTVTVTMRWVTGPGGRLSASGRS